MYGLEWRCHWCKKYVIEDLHECTPEAMRLLLESDALKWEMGERG